MSSPLDIGHLVGYVELDDSGVATGAKGVLDKVKELGSSGKGLAAVAGLGIATALVAGLTSAVDLQPAQAKLTAGLDLTASESARIGGVAGSLYADAYGGSMEEVGDTVAALVRNVAGMADASAADLERIAAKTTSVAQVAGQDTAAVARAVGTMIRSGIVPDADAALDILAAGITNNVDVAGDLLDTYSEYSTQFRKLGLDGSQALGLMSQGLQAGARDADSVADALKEFSDLGISGSKAAGDAFRTLGLDADRMRTQIAAGGETADAALGTVLDRLRAVPDPAARSAAAVGLFGEKAIDLGDALYALDPSTAVDGIEGLTDAAGRMDEQLNGTAKGSLVSLGRSLQTSLAEPIGNAALPLLTTLADTAGDIVVPALGAVGDATGAVAAGFAALPDGVQTSIVTLGALVALREPISGAFDAIKASTSSALDTVRLQAMYARDALDGGLGGAMSGVAGKARGLATGGIAALSGALGGPLGIAIAGVSIGIPLLSSLFGDNSDEADDAARANTDLARALRESNGVVTESVRLAAGKEAQDRGLLDMADALGLSRSRVVDAILGEADAYNELTDAANAYFDASLSSENAGDLQMTENADQVRDFIEGLDELAPTVEQTRADQEQLADAVGAGADAQGELGDQTDDVTGRLSDQLDQLSALRDLFEEFSGKARTVAQAQLDLADGLADMTDAIADNGVTLDRNTQAGRDNERAVLDQIEGVEQLSRATYDQTGSMGDAYGAYQSNIQALRDHLVELGYNEAEVDALVAAYGSIPEEEFTDIVQPGMTEAQTAADILRDKVLEIPDEHTVRTSALTAESVAALEALGVKTRTLPDGSVEVYADTTTGQNTIDTFIRNAQARTITLTAVTSVRSTLGFGLGGHDGGVVTRAYADGGIEAGNLIPMSGGLAQIVPPGVRRVIGDRVDVDEFYIPDNDDPRSLALGDEWATRRGMHLVPMAAGGIAMAGLRATPGNEGAASLRPIIINMGPTYVEAGATDPNEVARAVARAQATRQKQALRQAGVS